MGAFRDRSATTSGSFRPTKQNLYAAVKAIFHPSTNAGVDADDTDRELDVGAAGGASSFADLTGQIADAQIPDGIARDAEIPSKATNTDVDAETDDARFTTVAKVFRAIARKVRHASTTVRGIVLLARNADVDATETDTGRVLQVSSAKRLVERLAPAARLLPAYPAAGSRNNKTPKFDGDTLEWQEDQVSGAGGANPAAEALGNAASVSAGDTSGTLGGITYAQLPDLFMIQLDGVPGTSISNSRRNETHLIRKTETNETGGVVIQYSGVAGSYVRLRVDSGNIAWDADGFVGTLQLYSLKVPADGGATAWSAKAWKRGAIVSHGLPTRFYIRLADGTDGSSDSPDAGNANWQLISGVETFAGAWAAARNYKKGQIVDRQSKFYVRRADGRDLASDPPESNSADWQELGGGGGGLEDADVVTLGRLQEKTRDIGFDAAADWAASTDTDIYIAVVASGGVTSSYSIPYNARNFAVVQGNQNKAAAGILIVAAPDIDFSNVRVRRTKTGAVNTYYYGGHFEAFASPQVSGLPNGWKSYWYTYPGSGDPFSIGTAAGETFAVEKATHTAVWEGELADAIASEPWARKNNQAAIPQGKLANASPSGRSFGAYAWRDRRVLTPASVSGRTASTSGDGVKVTLLDDQRMDGGILADEDFVTDWEGLINLESSLGAALQVRLHTRHAFGAARFTHTRTYHHEAIAGRQITLPMVAFHSRSRVALGAYTPPGGTEIEITQEHLDGPSRITYEIEVVPYDPADTSARIASNISIGFQRLRVTSYQLQQARLAHEVRAESISFADPTNDINSPSSSTSDEELAPTAGSITVEKGAGAAQLLSDISGNDFDLAAGTYLVFAMGNGRISQAGHNLSIQVRDATDDSVLERSTSPAFDTGGATKPFKAIINLILAEEKTVNLFLQRNGGVTTTGVTARFLRVAA